MIEIIGTAAKNNVFLIISYIFIITLIIIIISIDRVKKRNKYMRLKKETLNLFIFSKEWEISEDDFFRQLIDENERLEAKVKICEKELSGMTWRSLVLAFIALLSLWLMKKVNKK